VQTFLPVANFHASAQMLDYRRLGRQRVEAKQLINAIITGEGGWTHHPAAHMWQHNLGALMRYHDICIAEWVRRGYKNTMAPFGVRVCLLPIWFGDDLFHSRHRAALLAKDPVFYQKYDWKEQPKVEYLWPTYPEN